VAVRSQRKLAEQLMPVQASKNGRRSQTAWWRRVNRKYRVKIRRG
jgi:hypothetical protein